MNQLYLSRATLNPRHERLGPVLFPDDPALRISVSHRLVWTLFPADAGPRPFLYRESAPSRAGGVAARGAFHLLSTLPPGDGDGLFDVETKPFAPDLRMGDILRFSLRANPAITRNRTVDGKLRVVRDDVVMHALHTLPRGEARIEARPRVVRKAGLAWLKAQGARCGFALVSETTLSIDGYEQFLIDPEGRRSGKRAVHSRLDFEGRLEVREPDLFLASLASGFGRTRAFGNGLMLIRRG